MKITIKKFYEAKRVNKELTELKAQFQHPVPENKSIADLNHIVINACMNIYARITDRVVISEVDKIIEQVKSFTSQHPVPDEAGEVYVWETKNPEQDLFRHPIINLTEKCHDLGWFDTKRGYWVDENGDSLGQCEWLRLSPVPLSGEDAGKGWISVEKENMPLETDLIVKHPFGVEAIHFFNAEWTFWYTGKSCGSDLIKSITHWKKP